MATPLPPLNPSQTGKRWPRNAPTAAAMAAVGPQFAGDQHSDGPLQRVAEQRRRGEALAAGAQHIGRADVAGADVADVARARRRGSG